MELHRSVTMIGTGNLAETLDKEKETIVFDRRNP